MTIVDASLTENTGPILAEGVGLAPLGGILPWVLIAAVFYFLILRPSAKTEKERKKRLDALTKGDEVILTGGIFGRISSIEEKIAVVEIADKVKIRVLRREIQNTQAAALTDDGKGSSSPKSGASS